MRRPLRGGPLGGAFSYLISSTLPLPYINPQSQAESKANNRWGRGGERTLTSATCLLFESPALQRKCVCAEGGGRLAQPSLKILDKNANPEGKERTRKESVNHEAPAPHPQPQLYGLHSCCGGKKWGDRTEGKKGRHHHLHERGPRGREAAAAEEGLRPAELNKAGLNF